MASILKKFLKSAPNPLLSLSYAYRLIIMINLISIPIMLFFYYNIALALSKYLETYEPFFIAEKLRYQAIQGLISYLFTLVILIMLFWAYKDAGEFLDNNDMLWISKFNFIEAIMLSLGFPFVFLGSLLLASDISKGRHIQYSSGLSMISFGSILILIGGLIGVISFIILIKLLFNIASEWGIQQADMAIALLIISIFLSMFFGSIEPYDPVTTVLKGITDTIEALINVMIAIALYKTFEKMGSFISKYELNREVLQSVINEIIESEEKVNIKEIASKHKIPYAIIKKEIIKKLSNGELKGSIIDTTYYPPKRKSL